MGMIPDVNDAKVLVVGSAVILVVLYLFVPKIKDGVIAVAEAVNPVDDNNVFNTGFDAAWKKVTGSDDSIGEDIYDLLHPEGQDF